MKYVREPDSFHVTISLFLFLVNLFVENILCALNTKIKLVSSYFLMVPWNLVDKNLEYLTLLVFR